MVPSAGVYVILGGMTALSQFLERNQITKARPLPLVHTTETYYLKKIVETGQIKAQRCNVFMGENLSYSFVGRAAYKCDSQQEAEYWELPTCLVFDFFIQGAKRILPIDSGAFSAKRYPNFINMMDLQDFDVGGDLKRLTKSLARSSTRPETTIGLSLGHKSNSS